MFSTVSGVSALGSGRRATVGFGIYFVFFASPVTPAASTCGLSLFGVLQQCLRTRVSPSLPPRKPRPFSGSLGLQHPCLLQPPKSGKPQTLRVWVTPSLVVPGLLLHLFHGPAVSLVQPRTIGRKRWRAAGDDCWVFPLVLSGFCEEYVAVSGVRVISPSLPFGPHK